MAESGPLSRPFEPPTGQGALAILEEVARSHDNCCSPALRHAARRLLGLGDCEPIQACIFCAPKTGWRCGKCDGMDVPKHSPRCPERLKAVQC